MRYPSRVDVSSINKMQELRQSCIETWSRMYYNLFWHCLTFGLITCCTVTSTDNGRHWKKEEVTQLLKLMDLSEGSTLIIIQDYQIGLDIWETLDSWTTSYGVVLISFELPHFNDVMPMMVEDVIRHRKVNIYSSRLNFVVFCDIGCLVEPDIFEMIVTVDRENGKRALLRHFSKWLFFSMKDITCGIPNLNIVLDNIAVVFKQGLNATKGDSAWLSTQTLLWNPKGREWSNLDCVHNKHNSHNTTTLLFPNAKNGLNGRKLEIGVLEWGTFCRKSTSSRQTHVSYTHVCRDLFDYLGISLNFSYVFVEPADHSWGEKLQNSSWRGLLGMAVRDEVDLVGVPFGTTMERVSVMTFSHMILYTPYQVSYKKLYSESNWLALVSCFKWEAYVCVLISLFWFIFLFAFLEKTNIIHDGNGHQANSAEHVSRALFTGISVSLHQGLVSLPRKMSGRVLLVTWCFFCTVITAVYTGNLTAFLAVNKEITPFTDLKELVKNDDYKIIIARGSYLETQMKYSQVEVMKTLWRRILASRTKRVNNSMEEYEYYKMLLKEGNYALIEVSGTLDDMDLTVPNLRRMKRDIMTLSLSLPFPLHSPLEPLFSERIMHLHEIGVFEGLIRKWASRKSPETDIVRNSALQLEIADLQSTLAACAAGVLMAVISLVIEYIYKQIQNN